VRTALPCHQTIFAQAKIRVNKIYSTEGAWMLRLRFALRNRM
jgi:hypothetical protein